MSEKDPWSGRDIRMKCASCMWFVIKVGKPAQADPTASHQIGRCRRHAPTMSGYPVVFVTDWCGDHKLDEMKI